MGNVSRCAHCGAGQGDVQYGFDLLQCLKCGNHTDLTTGEKVPVEPVFTGPEEAA